MHRVRKIIALVLIAFIASSLYASERPLFALVLSGGGARGISHLAVIEELENRGIVPDMVIGTSIGALVGGFYSAGYSASEIEKILMDTDIMSIMMRFNNEGGSSALVSPDSQIIDNILSLNFSKEGIGANNGLLDDQGLGGFFRRNLAKVLAIEDFDQLSIPFRAIGIDALTGEEIIFSDGSLYTAMRASMSLPLIFAPVKIADNVFVMDGGMANNLPVDVARDMGADYVLAVDVNDTMNRNGKLSKGEMETLSGSFDAFTSVITVTNSIPKYEMSDWVIVPDVNDYSTIDFNAKEEILEIGRAAVEENMQVFDELSSKLEGREENEYVRYESRPSYAIERIDTAGIDGYDREFSRFIGRGLDRYTIEELEVLLEKIVGYERLKNISYRIKEGVITLVPEHYSPASGIIAIGLIGNTGIKYNGTNEAYVAFSPMISAGGSVHLDNDKSISIGLIFNESLFFESRYSMPLFETGFLYGGFDMRYLNLAYNTGSSVYGSTSKNDFGSRLSGGVFYTPQRNLTADFSAGYDFTHLARVPNHLDFSAPDYEKSTNIHYFYLKTNVDYNTRGGDAMFSHGIEADLSLSVGVDLATSGYEALRNKALLGYSIDIGLEYVFGVDSMANIVHVDASSIRRYPKLKEAYTISKTGVLTPDYLYFFNGIRGSISDSPFYYEAGPYLEAFRTIPEKNSDYYTVPYTRVPFATLDTFNIGLKGGVGIPTDFGDIYVEAYVSFLQDFSASFMVGIR